MKITKKQLKRIIKEELERSLREANPVAIPDWKQRKLANVARRKRETGWKPGDPVPPQWSAPDVDDPGEAFEEWEDEQRALDQPG